MFIGAWALFNSAVVLGLSLLISFDMHELPDPETYQEYVSHLKECGETLQQDLESGRDDAVSRRERRIMDSLLHRVETCSKSMEEQNESAMGMQFDSRCKPSVFVIVRANHEELMSGLHGTR